MTVSMVTMGQYAVSLAGAGIGLVRSTATRGYLPELRVPQVLELTPCPLRDVAVRALVAAYRERAGEC